VALETGAISKDGMSKIDFDKILISC